MDRLGLDGKTLVTKEDVANEMRMALNYLQGILQEEKDQVRPIVLVRSATPDDDGNMKIVSTIIIIRSMDDHRQESFEQLGYEMVSNQKLYPLVATLISETWQSEHSISEPGPFVRPSQSPDRREHVTLVTLSFDGKVLCTSIPILRDVDNSIVLAHGDATTTDAIKAYLLRQLYIGALRASGERRGTNND